MEERMNRRQVSFGSNVELTEKDRNYWETVSNEEKFETITYLRECFYGPEATTGRLQKTLNDFGAPSIDMSHFKEIGNVFRMGSSPVQIDIINKANGIDIKECYARRKIITIEGIPISVISKEDLIKNKQASGRHQDLADVESLEGKPEVEKI